MKSLLIHGMHGLGDNLHQRAAIRMLMETYDVYLETSWVSLYHDLIAKGLRVMHKPTRLRTQAKNAFREHSLFWPGEVPAGTPSLSFHYGPESIARVSSHTIMQSMLNCAGLGERYAESNYSLPVPEAWDDAVYELVKSWNVPADKPLMVYRPLTVRPEWRGGERRNAPPEAYAELLAAIRHRYFVVSVADLQSTREWIVGPEFDADVKLHRGELPFESLAALFAAADVVFTSGGFATILGSAVGTPVISIVGGEPASWHADAARYAPYLGLNCDGGIASMSEKLLRFSDDLHHPECEKRSGPLFHAPSAMPPDEPLTAAAPAAYSNRISPYAPRNVRIFPPTRTSLRERELLLQGQGLKA